MADGAATGDGASAPSFVLSLNIDQSTITATATGLASPLQSLIGQLPGGTQAAQPWLPGLDLSTAEAQLGLSSGKFGAYVAVSDGEGNQLASVFFFLDPAASGGEDAAIGIALDTPVDLAATPLFGAVLAGVRITGFGVSYASRAFAAGEIVLPSGPGGATVPYATVVPPGFGLTATVDAGSSAQTFTLPAPDSSSPSPSAVSVAGNGGTRAAPADDTDIPQVTWFTVQKSLGPLFVDRIGVAAGDGTLGLAIDASLTTDVVDVDLTGFTISFSPGSIASSPPSVSLDGLAVAVDAGELQIAGALTRTTGSDKNTEYDGALVIGIGSYVINAAGSYTTVGGAPSLFVFGVVKGEFGGPPAFFVTGIAAGFGVNRALKLPAPDQVAAFPIVEAATGSGPQDTTDALNVLNTGGWVPPVHGEYWVAAGVTFRSFELIDGFALLTVEFGQELVIALLGTATLALPTSNEGGRPFANVEIALEAVLRPAEGVFSLEALLTPNSFIIDPSCQLTGGLAVDLWFGASPHPGDFVVTLGGYHPLFIPPSYYPAVPRLGFSWHLSDALKATGDCYFAITPACVMGGGLLSVTFAAGGLKAWFTAQADFLMYWRPFFYEVDVSVDIGVSYTGSIGFISATFTVELGVGVQLWGRPLAGIAHVNWWVISFDIAINGGGSPPANAGTLNHWSDFAQASLPASGNVCRPRPAGGLQSIITLPSKETIWVFSGDEISLATETLIPAAQMQVDGPTVTTKTVGTVSVYSLGNASVTTLHEVCVAPWTTADWQPGQPLPTGIDVSGWNWTPVSGNVPAALWGPRGSDTAPPLSSTVVSGVTGMTGALQPVIAEGLTIGAQVLQTEETARGLPLPVTTSGGPGPAAAGDSRIQVAATIDDPTVTALRAEVIAAAGTAGLGTGLSAAALPLLAGEVYAVLTSQPMLGPPGTTGPQAAASAGQPATQAPAAPPAHTAGPGAAAETEPAETDANGIAPATPAVRALFRDAAAVVADRWSSSAERRLLSAGRGVAGAAEAGGEWTVAAGATVVWDLPPDGPRALRLDGTAPLWIVALDACQRPSTVPAGQSDGPLPADIARVAVTALGADAGQPVAAGWHGGTALRQVASQALLGDGAVVRPQSPHGVPLRRTRRGQGVRRELGLVTGRQLADRTWTQAADGSLSPGWIETWLPSWCRAVLVGLRPAADTGADLAGVPRVTMRRLRPGQPEQAPVAVSPEAADADGAGLDDTDLGGTAGRWRFAVPDGALPGPGEQLIVRAWAPARWRLDGVYGFAEPSAALAGWPPAGGAPAPPKAVAPAGDGDVRVWWA
jgi:hypothetical protein